jgi:hypothetical protein
VNDCGVTDSNVVADEDREIVGKMNDGPILNVCGFSNLYEVDVSTKHASVPHAASSTQTDIANDCSPAGNKDVLRQLRFLGQEKVESFLNGHLTKGESGSAWIWDQRHK